MHINTVLHPCFNMGLRFLGLIQKLKQTMQYILGYIALTLASMTMAMAASPAEQRGRYSRKQIARDAIPSDRVTPSPLKIAPPFRTLHLRYPVDTLAEAFAEGIYTGHPTMPMFSSIPTRSTICSRI